MDDVFDLIVEVASIVVIISIGIFTAALTVIALRTNTSESSSRGAPTRGKLNHEIYSRPYAARVVRRNRTARSGTAEMA
jgi:hypothetical protein